MTHNKCLIWGTAAHLTEDRENDRTFVMSPRAGGAYGIDGLAALKVSGLTDPQKVLLSDYIYEQNLLGERPFLSKERVDAALARRPRTIGQRCEALLGEISRNCEHLGDEPKVPAIEPSVYWAAASAKTQGEQRYLLDALEADGLVRVSRTDDGSSVEITPLGYAHLANLGSQSGKSSRAFVAMWFAQEMNQVFDEGIEPAIAASGYEAVVIRKQEYLGKIDDEIIAEIRQARFVVADFTCDPPSAARGGVYFEAGFALGLGIPVVWTCRASVIEHVHFDTRQYNHIVWENPLELRAALTNRILAAIGRGPVV